VGSLRRSGQSGIAAATARDPELRLFRIPVQGREYRAKKRASGNGIFGGLFRIEAQGLELLAPFSRRIAEPLDADAARQVTFHGCSDKVGCEEGK
jgi:hypothetical protein